MNELYQVIVNLKLERSAIHTRLCHLKDLKKRPEDFNKLGSIMCQMLDTQEKIMESYIEILTLRILYLEENIKTKDTKNE